MYLRFVVPQFDHDSHQRLGVFGAAYPLLRSGSLADYEYEALRADLNWFVKHLPVPRMRNWPARSIFWFKDSARDSIKRIWEMIYLLREHGYAVEMIRCTMPGTVVYEDTLQLAAVPFRNRSRPRSRTRRTQCSARYRAGAMRRRQNYETVQ